MVKEINIYEDITKPFISGNLTVVDANNIFEILPIGGFERLEMQLMSPHTDNNYNFTIETGRTHNISILLLIENNCHKTHKFILFISVVKR